MQAIYRERKEVYRQRIDSLVVLRASYVMSISPTYIDHPEKWRGQSACCRECERSSEGLEHSSEARCCPIRVRRFGV